jgi:hypothetical protein
MSQLYLQESEHSLDRRRSGVQVSQLSTLRVSSRLHSIQRLAQLHEALQVVGFGVLCTNFDEVTFHFSQLQRI